MTVDAIMLNRDAPRAAGLQGVLVCRFIIGNLLTHAVTLIANAEPVMTAHVVKFHV